MPHVGTTIPDSIESRLVSPWLSRRDADWHIDRLYDFAQDMDATIVATAISRTVIDVNRDPSGATLYPGQATTELCPTTTFDGEPLYREGATLNPTEIAERRTRYFDPYHATLAQELARLRALHPKVVLYDCHSIRSRIPRLFEGELPHFNIGTNGGASCDPALRTRVAKVCDAPGFRHVVDGRFKGGSITRRFGKPQNGVHAVQMELACRAYMLEPIPHVNPENWPGAYDPAYASPVRAILVQVIEACHDFARGISSS
jgi:formiminoglutamase